MYLCDYRDTTIMPPTTTTRSKKRKAESVDNIRARFAAELAENKTRYGPPNEETCMRLLKEYNDDLSKAASLYVKSVDALRFRASKKNPHEAELLKFAKAKNPELSDEIVIVYRCIRIDGPNAEHDPMMNGIDPKKPNAKNNVRSHVGGKKDSQWISCSRDIGSGAAQFAYLSEKAGGDPERIQIVVMAFDLAEKDEYGELVNVDLSGNRRRITCSS